MRFLQELAVFAAMAAVAFAIIFTFACIVGSPFGLRPTGAAILAVLALGFWFPAFANVHIAVGGDDAQLNARVCAAIRAFGMLLCSAVLTAPVMKIHVPVAVSLPLFVLGILCWFGSFAYELLYG
jgi:hypothetical protein